MKGVSSFDQRKDISAWTSRLQLADEETKDFLLDLVYSPVSSSDQRPRYGLEIDDIISQKGKGLIVFLYGKLSRIFNIRLKRLITGQGRRV